MQDPSGQPHELVEHDRLEHWMIVGGKAMAVTGGIVLVALVAMSLVSIIGRKLGFGPVTGDIELMQAGMAVAGAAFLPYCTLLGEHLKVEFFTENMAAGTKRRVDGLWDLVIGLIASVLAWRTAVSAMSTFENGEVTPLVSLPVWIPVAALVPSLALMAVFAIYRSWVAYFRQSKEAL